MLQIWLDLGIQQNLFNFLEEGGGGGRENHLTNFLLLTVKLIILLNLTFIDLYNCQLPKLAVKDIIRVIGRGVIVIGNGNF